MRSLLLLTVVLCTGALCAQEESPPPPLYWAIANNDAQEAWRLTDPTQPEPVMPEPEDLSWAVTRGAGEAFDVLTYRGAPANAILLDGRNLLFPASEQGRLDLFRKIANAGAQLDQLDSRGLGLLHVGVVSVQPIMVNHLLARGVAPASRSDLGITPLMVACQGGRLEAVQTLLAWGANPDDEDYLGRPVLWYAQDGGDAATVSLITSELSPPERPEPSGATDAAPPPSPEQTPPEDPSTPGPESLP